LSAHTPLKQTPLVASHRAAGARLIDFGGWEMPVQYKPGILKEHKAVREHVGLFDVCHMGEVSLRGPKAAEAVQGLITGDVGALDDGAALYTLMCLENGGIVDDCIVYRRSESNYLIILNASNRAKDLNWIRTHAAGAEIVDESDDTGLIAVQGPKAVALVDSLSSSELSKVRRFRFANADVGGVACMVARTGYTGEDGFELACAAGHTEALWNALLEGGAAAHVQPIGLGARDTLRLEAKLSLYGNDIDETTTPLEACLGWAVKLDAGPFLGRDALLAQQQAGVTRKLVGMTLEGRGIARHGYDILDRTRPEGAVLGQITSGTTGPTVGKAIALGYVPTEYAKSGTSFVVDCRGKDIPATVHKGPFYKRS
jgi:aminomethyltransferase